MSALRLRPARAADSALLLAWRNDPLTRAASVDTAEVALADHERWLAASLANEGRRLLVAEEHAQAVGSLRADRLPGGAWELSWTVAPHARGRGLGQRMVALLAQELEGPLVARVRAENIASRRIAEACGLVLFSSEGGLLEFRSADSWP